MEFLQAPAPKQWREAQCQMRSMRMARVTSYSSWCTLFASLIVWWLLQPWLSGFTGGRPNAFAAVVTQRANHTLFSDFSARYRWTGFGMHIIERAAQAIFYKDFANARLAPDGRPVEEPARKGVGPVLSQQRHEENAARCGPERAGGRGWPAAGRVTSRGVRAFTGPRPRGGRKVGRALAGATHYSGRRF